MDCVEFLLESNEPLILSTDDLADAYGVESSESELVFSLLEELSSMALSLPLAMLDLLSPILGLLAPVLFRGSV